MAPVFPVETGQRIPETHEWGCCYDGARLPVARFGNTVARETTRGDEGSYRQSADGLWVNPFKRHLPLSCCFFRFSLSQSPRPPPSLRRSVSEAETCRPPALFSGSTWQKGAFGAFSLLIVSARPQQSRSGATAQPR